MWRRAAPLAVQLAHSSCVADDGALADAAVADDWANRPTVTWDLGIGGHAGTVAEHHWSVRTQKIQQYKVRKIARNDAGDTFVQFKKKSLFTTSPRGTHTSTWARSDPRYRPLDRRWSWCPAGSSQGYSDMTQQSGSCNGAARWTIPAWRCSRCGLAPCSSRLRRRMQREDNVWAYQDCFRWFYPLPNWYLILIHLSG